MWVNQSNVQPHKDPIVMEIIQGVQVLPVKHFGMRKLISPQASWGEGHSVFQYSIQ